jgi:hypothetical protein
VPWHICTIHLEAGRACRAKPRCPRGQLGRKLARSARLAARTADKGAASTNAADDMQTEPTVDQGNEQHTADNDMRCDTTALGGTGYITDGAIAGTRLGEACQDIFEKKRKKAPRTAEREARRTAKRAKKQHAHEARTRMGTIELSDDDLSPGISADDPPIPLDDDALDDPFDFGEGSLWPDMAPRRDDDVDHLALVASTWKAPKRLKSPPAHHLETLVSSVGASGSGSAKRQRTKERQEMTVIDRRHVVSLGIELGGPAQACRAWPCAAPRGSHGHVELVDIEAPEALGVHSSGEGV